MPYKATTSKAPAAPSMYKSGADRMLGMDTATADGIGSLNHACGASHFDYEQGNISAEIENEFELEKPGMCNLIRGKLGCVVKRGGIKRQHLADTLSKEFPDKVQKCVSNDKVTAVFGTYGDNLLALTLIFFTDGYFGVPYAFENFSDNGISNSECTFCEIINDRLIAGFKLEMNNGNPEYRLLIATVSYTGYENGRLSGYYFKPDGYAEITKPCTDFLPDNLSRGDFNQKLCAEYDYIWGREAWGEPPAFEGYMSVVKPPRISIGNTKDGGSGSTYEPVNLLSPYVCEGFTVKVEETITIKLGLTQEDIDETGEVYLLEHVYGGDGATPGWTIKGAVKLNKLGDNGYSITLKPYDVGFPYIENGEDNVYVYYKRAADAIKKGFAKICACTLSTSFGLARYKDRLFLSGNPESPSAVYYSEMDNPTCFSDLNYLTFGNQSTKVMAIAGQDTQLAVLTDNGGYMVNGTLNTDKDEFSPDALFTISRRFITPTPVCAQRPVVFENEILYMSERGVCAISASESIDNQYSAQIRSEYINRWLLRENLKESMLCSCGDFLVIGIGKSNHMYVLDGLQTSTVQYNPFSYKQYEGYFFDGCACDFLWRHGDAVDLCLNGIVGIGHMPFEGGRNADYTDEWYRYINGKPDYKKKRAIRAYWETQNIQGVTFYNKKSYARLGVQLDKAVNVGYTSTDFGTEYHARGDGHEQNMNIRIWYRKNNQPWKLLKKYGADFNVFRYDAVDYGNFTYRPRVKVYTVDKKIKIKKAYSLKLRFENDIDRSAVMLQSFGLSYTM